LIVELLRASTMARTVIGTSDLERMRMSVLDVQPSTTAEDQRNARKGLSDSRISRWPNTLDANRAQKERARAEREAKLEAARQVIDRQEAEGQKQRRMAAIERANMLLYEQTDKMKTLRGAQLFTDVIEDRKYQVQERRMRAQMEKVRDDRFMKIQNSLIKEGDAKEQEEARKRAEKNQLMAKHQQEQLAEYKQTFIDRLLLERREGELIKLKVADDLVKAKEEKARRRREAMQAALDTKISNEKLEDLRGLKVVEEQKIEAKRLSDAADKDRLKVRMKTQFKLRFDEAQRIKMQMIERATKQLEELKAATDSREEKQAEEARAAEDAEQERRRARREKQQRAIDRSRTMQLEMRKRRAERDGMANAQMAQHWRERNEQVEEEEKAEEMEKMARNIKVRQHLEKQMAQQRRGKLESRAAQLHSDQETMNMMGEEDKRFLMLAQAELEEAEAEGKNTIPIRHAMLAKDKVMMPVGGIRV
jgi:hypothetical protein